VWSGVIPVSGEKGSTVLATKPTILVCDLCLYVYMYVCVYVCISVCGMFVCVYVCVSVCGLV